MKRNSFAVCVELYLFVVIIVLDERTTFNFDSITVGGRLERELEYTKKSLGEGYGGTNELLIQTPNIEGTNILTVKAMKQHLEALAAASNVSVDIFDQ